MCYFYPNALFGNPAGGWRKDADIGAFRNHIINDALGPGSVSYSLARRILYGNWTRIEHDRPYEWGNLVEESSREFKEWINRDAPMTYLGGPGKNGDPNNAIWYAYGRGGNAAPLQVDTLYIMTYGQKTDLSKYFDPGSTSFEDD